MVEYPSMVVMEIAAPVSSEGMDSGSMTFQIIWKLLAPIDFAASTIPAFISFKELSTMRAM